MLVKHDVGPKIQALATENVKACKCKLVQMKLNECMFVYAIVCLQSTRNTHAASQQQIAELSLRLITTKSSAHVV